MMEHTPPKSGRDLSLAELIVKSFDNEVTTRFYTELTGMGPLYIFSNLATTTLEKVFDKLSGEEATMVLGDTFKASHYLLSKEGIDICDYSKNIFDRIKLKSTSDIVNIELVNTAMDDIVLSLAVFLIYES
jgi:hypothetical protein